MLRGLISVFRPSYPAVIVYMLQSTELGSYLDRLVESCGKVLIAHWKSLIAAGEYRALVSELLVMHYDKYYARSIRHLQDADTEHKNFVANDLSAQGIEDLAQAIAQGHGLAPAKCLATSP